MQKNTQHFRALFAHLLEDRAPLVIHCTAGKDRTGFACALILHTLGVSEEVISQDYLLTNRFYRRDPNSSSDLPDDVKQVLGSVQASFLAAAFEAINTDYGDLESYLRDGLGLGKAERAHLEARYRSEKLIRLHLPHRHDLRGRLAACRPDVDLHLVVVRVSPLGT